MLHIILMILKIIGILLLVLLILVLLAAAAVLFVPVRYRVKGEKEEDNFCIRAEVFWLMHLFRVKALYPEPGRTVVKLLWFTLYDSDQEDGVGKKEKRKRKNKNHRKGKKNRLQEKKKSASVKTEKRGADLGKTDPQKKDSQEIRWQNRERVIKEESGDSAEKEKIIREWRTQDTQTNMQRESASAEKKAEHKIEEREKKENTGKIQHIIRELTEKIIGFFEKIKEILRKIKNAIENIWYTIKRLYDRIVKIRDDIGYYIEVFGEKETKQAFLLCRQEWNRIWKNIRPAKCRAELVIGTGEPDTTGYILAVHGILYPIIGNDIIIEPDFENQVLEGKLFLKGRITVFVLLHAVIRIYFDKNIRYFLKRFKREEA